MINETRRRRIDEVCDGALARNGDERAAFIAAACGDDAALRKHVEELLAHAQTAEKFLAMPAAAVAADVLAENSGVSMIGRQLASYDCAPDRGLARRRTRKRDADSVATDRTAVAGGPDGMAASARRLPDQSCTGASAEGSIGSLSPAATKRRCS